MKIAKVIDHVLLVADIKGQLKFHIILTKTDQPDKSGQRGVGKPRGI